MLTVSTYEELASAVRNDEPFLHLEGQAKYFYEKKCGETLGGGLLGVLPGMVLLGGIPGAVIGAGIGALIASSSRQPGEQDIARFLALYYRRSSTGVTYIELSHR